MPFATDQTSNDFHNFAMLKTPSALVDHPTQLICIWIFICQHTKKTSQELRMLSSVTINCQVTKIVMNPGSQLSVL